MSNRYIELEKSNKAKSVAQNSLYKHFNLGIFVYVSIFAYLVFCVLSFSFSQKVNYTVAEMGSIVESETFNGLIIKDETIVTSNMSGYPHFFVPQGQKVKQGTYISIISESQNIEDALPNLSVSSNDVKSSSDNYEYLKDQLRNYVLNKENQGYYYTYSAKNDLNSSVFDITNTIKISDIDLATDFLEEDSVYTDLLSNAYSIYKAPISGTVSYHFDGFEDFNIDNFTVNNLNNNISINEVLTNNTVEQGNHIFKIINNYEWYIAAEIDPICQKEIEAKEYVELNFHNQDIVVDAFVYSIITENNKVYAIFKIDRFANNFLTDRFVDFTITYNKSEGIKIPNASVVEKEFITIPIEALMSKSGSKGITKVVYNEDAVNGQSIEFIKADIYFVKDNIAYLCFESDVNLGDEIEYMEDNVNKTYQLSNQARLEGVYVINKGYPAFRLIETINFNEDYRIVKANTSFGVIMYDRIVSDANAEEYIN